MEITVEEMVGGIERFREERGFLCRTGTIEIGSFWYLEELRYRFDVGIEEKNEITRLNSFKL